MSVKVMFTAHLPVVYKKRRKHYLASCPVLDVHSQGETKEKAKYNLIEALILFLESCFERGTLDEVLKECGFKAAITDTKSPGKQPHYEDFIEITIPLFASDEHAKCPA